MADCTAGPRRPCTPKCPVESWEERRRRQTPSRRPFRIRRLLPTRIGTVCPTPSTRCRTTSTMTGPPTRKRTVTSMATASSITAAVEGRTTGSTRRSPAVSRLPTQGALSACTLGRTIDHRPWERTPFGSSSTSTTAHSAGTRSVEWERIGLSRFTAKKAPSRSPPSSLSRVRSQASGTGLRSRR